MRSASGIDYPLQNCNYLPEFVRIVTIGMWRNLMHLCHCSVDEAKRSFGNGEICLSIFLNDPIYIYRTIAF